MANLSIPEITRDTKEYRAELLVEKAMSANDKTNNFMTDDGLFNATGIIINGERYDMNATNKRQEMLDRMYGMILSMKGQRNQTIELVGKFSGKNNTSTVNLTKIEKSEEFGGQPAGGARENKGLKFERDLTAQLNAVITGADVKGKFAEAARTIVDQCSKAQGSPAIKVEQVGGANVPRPLGYASGKAVVLPPNHKEHGAKLTDVNITHKNGKVSHLSLKFGGTLTFVNSGVKGQGKAFPENEVKSGMVTNNLGKSLLKALGIDNESFCEVFNAYGSGKKAVEKNKVDVSSTVDRNALKALISTAIGSDYFMVHGKENGTIDFWYMSPENNSAMSTIASGIELIYGGQDGKAKRIDMKFKNNYFEFKLNIRNKQSGVYPSHFLLDYKSLAGTGKVTLR
jgi:hypothetical protein